MNRHLNISAEFADFLNKQGQLEALVWAYKQFRDRQNYPFYQRDKNIIKQTLIKAIAEGKLTLKEILSDKFQKDLNDATNKIYGRMPEVAELFELEFRKARKEREEKEREEKEKKEPEIKIESVEEKPPF